jgi:hypothetical protein
MTDTPLGTKMRALAATGHADADNLNKLADEFEAAQEGFYAADQTVPAPRFLGCWARARKAWSVASGEPLI